VEIVSIHNRIPRSDEVTGQKGEAGSTEGRTTIGQRGLGGFSSIFEARKLSGEGASCQAEAWCPLGIVLHGSERWVGNPHSLLILHNADGLRASEHKHAVEDADSDRDFGVLPGIGPRPHAVLRPRRDRSEPCMGLFVSREIFEFPNYWLWVSDVDGLASASDQAKTQELPGRGDDFESEPGILSFCGRTELRPDLRRPNSAPNASFTLTEVA
jgi:hypothetical protein